MDGGDHEWELCKENVQPLRQGRHISSLVAALQSDQSDEHAFMTQKKNFFELELRTYSGDDPFSVWDSYAKWTEQHFPKGGHDGQLITLLERCLREFQADERYTNDPRFIQMWIKFACFTKDPGTIYSYMFDNSIGANVASLYVEWAQSMERNADIKKADAIFLEGLNRQAEPKDLLLQRYHQFQSRVARNITLQIAENQNPGQDMGDDVDKRTALERLKTSGPSHKVGAVRTGNVKLGSAGSLKDSRPAVVKQLPSQAISVYCDDENVPASLAPQQSNEWQSLPVQAVDNRENDKKPATWTNAKIKQMPGTVPSVAPTIPFQIHEDLESATHETPRKTTLINTQPLSSRKSSQTDVLSNVRCPPKSSTYFMEIPMYQKDRIYNGLTEYSFEELRAVKFWKVKREREALTERLRLEADQKLKEDRVQQQLLQVTEQLALLQAQVRDLNVNRHADQQQQTAQPVPQPDPQLQEPHVSMCENIQSSSDLQVTSKQGVPALEHADQQQPVPQPDPQLQEPHVSMCENIQSSSDLQVTSKQGVPALETSSQPPGWHGASGVDISNTHSGSNSFVTPTNVMDNLSSSQRTSGGAHNVSSRLRTPIFNSASTYSLVGSSLGRSQSQPLHANTSVSNSSLESTVSSTDSNNSIAPVGFAVTSNIKRHSTTAMPVPAITTPMGKDELSAESSVTFGHSKLRRLGTPKSDRPTPEDQSSTKGSLTAASPTVYTKEALQCVMGMFSTSFGSQDHTISEEVMDPLCGTTVPSTQAPFQILEDTTKTFQPQRQSLKSASVKKGLVHLPWESDESQENMLTSSVPKPPTVSSGTSRMYIYRDEPDDTTTGSDNNGLNISSEKQDYKTALGGMNVQNIYSDEPDKTATDRNVAQNIYRDEPADKTGTGDSKGLYIYHDKSADKTSSHDRKGLNIYCDDLENRAIADGRKGLNIYCDENQKEVEAASVKKSARRGLAYSHVAPYDDVDMVDVNNMSSCDFTIECQARNDTTLAPLDSFFVQAKAASTPCVGAFEKLRSKTQEHCDAVSTCLPSSCSNSSLTTLDSSAPTPSKHLSPIFEGSGEGSGEESKSYQPLLGSKAAARSSSLSRPETGRQDNIQEVLEVEDDISSRDESMCEDIQADMDRSCHHQIDTTAYIGPDSSERTEAQLSQSVIVDPKEPFDDSTIAYFLKNLNPPITKYPNFTACSDQFPDISNECFLYLGGLYICVEKCIGEGGHAKIYLIDDHCVGGDDTISIESTVTVDKVIKVQTPPCYWEFYVSCELRSRLAGIRTPISVMPSVMEIQRGYFFENCSVLQMIHAPHGSLLNLVNMYKNERSLLARVEPFACLLTIELLHLFEQIHKCDFIHGDVKPDNFLLLDLPRIKESMNPQEVFGSELRLVRLIDYGQSIDMRKFSSGTTFMAKVVTSGFQCIEMRTDQPWTFQTDLFGLVGTIHVVLFGSYMNVFQEQGLWKVTANFVRKWNVPLWKHLFKELLNIPSCDQQPDLPSLRAEFEKYFMHNLIPDYNMWAREMKSLDKTSE